MFADYWDDNKRSDPRQEVARLEEGWAHPPQHQPRHIGDEQNAKDLTFFSIFDDDPTISTLVAETR